MLEEVCDVPAHDLMVPIVSDTVTKVRSQVWIGIRPELFCHVQIRRKFRKCLTPILSFFWSIPPKWIELSGMPNKPVICCVQKSSKQRHLLTLAQSPSSDL